MNNPLISVIVPVYKVEKYLDRCVESIVNQTYKNLEIILVDDGSPDNSPAMCDKWAEKDSRIKVIHKENEGVFRARNTGIENSTGEYLSFIDSDDWVTKDYAEKLLSWIICSNCDVAACSMCTTNTFDVETEKTDVENKVILHDEIMRYMPTGLCYLCGKLYKSELFRNLPQLPDNISVSEDMMLNCFVYKKCERVLLSNQKMYFYFRHTQSVLSGKITYRIIDDSMLAYKTVDDDYDKTALSYVDFIFNKVMNDFFLINSVIRNNDCLDRYECLRKDILKYKKYIFSFGKRNQFETKHKLGAFLLMLFPKLYNRTVLIRKDVRGY